MPVESIVAARPAKSEKPLAEAAATRSPIVSGGQELRLTVDDIDYPFYLVNNNFEVEWCNAQALERVLGQSEGLAEEITDRNIFRLFLDADKLRQAESWDEMIRFHFSLAKNRLSKEELGKLRTQVGGQDISHLEEIYEVAQSVGRMSVHHTEVNMAPRGSEEWYDLYATFFREGVVFAYVPTGTKSESLLALLSRREVVIRDLLKKRRPFLTPLAVLVADLQNSVRICAELPPEEYFELVNDVWVAMDPAFRKYYATHGKHVGDGMVYYFFPQPDCDYLLNAILCAYEMKEMMRDLSRQWLARKNWTNDLLLNSGVDEGEEWFGSYQTPTHLEFTVLGDTINRAGRMSDFARGGSVWASKALLGRLTPEDRQNVHFGIRRSDDNGAEVIVSNTYSRISNLVDLDDPKNQKFNDIATLIVTELIGVDLPDQRN